VAQLSTWISTTELDLSPDVRMLSASMLAMIATVVVFGTAPMLLARRTAPIDAMKRQQGGEPARAVSLREALVVVQVALCLLLLVGAALFARSFAALAYRDLGFDRASVLVAPVDSTYSRIPASDRLSLYERLRAAAAAVPGVRRVALSMATPLGNAGVRFTPAVAVETGPVDWTRASRILTNMIGPGWFETYGTHLIAGRDFTAADTNGSPEVVIVNEAFARKFFAGAVPVGRTMRMSRPGLSSDGHVTVDVVALVENAAFTSARNAVEPTLYRPLAQVADARLLKAIPSISISVQAEPGIAPSHLQSSVSQVITAIDGDLEVTPVPVKAQLDAGYVRERLLGLLSGFFAMLGLALAAIGVYAVTSQSVHGRRRELGIRMALGADGASLVRLVVRRFALLAATGAAIGGVASLWAGGAVASLLFGVTAGDPFAFTLAAVTALVTCSVAGWLPARRAARIEPMIVLRES
jgi:predicted permease